jgi:hypothetical protein
MTSKLRRDPPSRSVPPGRAGRGGQRSRRYAQPRLFCVRERRRGTSAGMPPSRRSKIPEALTAQGSVYCLIIAWPRFRVLPAPPRSPAQFRFPGAVGIVFDFPWLCRRRRGTARSLLTRIGQCREKCHPRLWPRQTFSRRNSRPRRGARFERRQRPARVQDISGQTSSWVGSGGWTRSERVAPSRERPRSLLRFKLLSQRSK